MADEKSFQELQNLVQRSVTRSEPTTQKAVLMLQPSKLQGQIWQAALTSQGITVIWEPGNLDPTQLLDQMKVQKLNLPDCLLIDTEVLGSNPYAFCRWCHSQHPDIKVVLVSSSQREISLPEHHWAVYQGAQDLLPGVQLDSTLADIAASVSRILVVLNWPPLQQASLESAISPLLAQPKTPQAIELPTIVGLNASTPVSADYLNSPNLSSSGISSSGINQPMPTNPPLPAPPRVSEAAPPPSPSPAESDKSSKSQKKRTYRGISY